MKQFMLPRDRLTRWCTLAICLAPIGGAYAYNWGFQLTQGKCLFQRIVGIPSPSCGLTRSFMAIARGDWVDALSFHAFGPFLFAAFLGTSVHVSVELIRGKSFTPWYKFCLQKPSFLILLGILFFAYYGLRLFARYGDLSLTDSVFQTTLWQGFVAGAKAL